MKQHIDNADDLACKFFEEFARFEYALKVAGYNPGDGPAKPCWEKFAKSASVVEYFNNQHAGILGQAIQSLLEQSPRQQVFVEGQLRWQTRKAAGKVAEQLCDYVRRVRDNLFQGGKLNPDWIDPNRSEQLIRHSLTILQAFLKSSPKVAEAFIQ